MPKHRLSQKRLKELFGVVAVRPRGPRMRRLGAQELKDKFGITPVPKLTGEKKRRAARANELFNDMYFNFGESSIDVFRRAAEKLHSHALNNMSECPEFVLNYMAEELKPENIQRHRERRARRLHASIEQAQTHLRRLV